MNFSGPAAIRVAIFHRINRFLLILLMAANRTDRTWFKPVGYTERDYLTAFHKQAQQHKMIPLSRTALRILTSEFWPNSAREQEISH